MAGKIGKQGFTKSTNVKEDMESHDRLRCERTLHIDEEYFVLLPKCIAYYFYVT